MFKKIVLGALAAALMGMIAVPALADDHDFKIINKGDHTVAHVYISPVSEDKWGDDIFADGSTIEAGAEQTFTIDTDCAMDVRVIYTDDHIDILKNINTCTDDMELEY